MSSRLASFPRSSLERSEQGQRIDFIYRSFEEIEDASHYAAQKISEDRVISSTRLRRPQQGLVGHSRLGRSEW